MRLWTILKKRKLPKIPRNWGYACLYVSFVNFHSHSLQNHAVSMLWYTSFLSTKKRSKAWFYIYTCILALLHFKWFYINTFETVQQAGAPKYRSRATLWAVTLSDFPPLPMPAHSCPRFPANTTELKHTHSNTKTVHYKVPAHSCHGPSPQIKHNMKRNTR